MTYRMSIRRLVDTLIESRHRAARRAAEAYLKDLGLDDRDRQRSLFTRR